MNTPMFVSSFNRLFMLAEKLIIHNLKTRLVLSIINNELYIFPRICSLPFSCQLFLWITLYLLASTTTTFNSCINNLIPNKRHGKKKVSYCIVWKTIYLKIYYILKKNSHRSISDMYYYSVL